MLLIYIFGFIAQYKHQSESITNAWPSVALSKGREYTHIELYLAQLVSSKWQESNTSHS